MRCSSHGVTCGPAGLVTPARQRNRRETSELSSLRIMTAPRFRARDIRKFSGSSSVSGTPRRPALESMQQAASAEDESSATRSRVLAAASAGRATSSVSAAALPPSTRCRVRPVRRCGTRPASPGSGYSLPDSIRLLASCLFGGESSCSCRGPVVHHVKVAVEISGKRNRYVVALVEDESPGPPSSTDYPPVALG